MGLPPGHASRQTRFPAGPPQPHAQPTSWPRLHGRVPLGAAAPGAHPGPSRTSRAEDSPQTCPDATQPSPPRILAPRPGVIPARGRGDSKGAEDKFLQTRPEPQAETLSSSCFASLLFLLLSKDPNSPPTPGRTSVVVLKAKPKKTFRKSSRSAPLYLA